MDLMPVEESYSYEQDVVVEESLDRNIWKERLQKVQTAIHKLTQDAVSATASGQQKEPKHQHQEGQKPEDDSNASFLLGIDLFGQDVSVVERGVREKLEECEDQIEALLSSSVDNNINDTCSKGGNTNVVNDENNANNNMSLEDQEDKLREQAQDYKDRIQFLKLGSLARTELDESMTQTSAALSSSPHLVQAAQHLVKASEYVQQIHMMMAKQPKGYTGANHTHFRIILQRLDQDIRHQRIELVHKACHVLDTSILFHAHSLSVKHSPALEDAYQVLLLQQEGQSDSQQQQHQALHDTLRRFTFRLYQEVIEPLVLEPLRRATTGPAAPVTPGETSSSQVPQSTSWKLQETTTDTAKKFLTTSSTIASSSHQKKTHNLEWRPDNNDTQDGNNSSLQVWKTAMENLQHILRFVHSKILLEQGPLVEFVGNKLFGPPNVLPSLLQLRALGLQDQHNPSSSSWQRPELADDGILQLQLVKLLEEFFLPYAALTSQDQIEILHLNRDGLVQILEPFESAMKQLELIQTKKEDKNKKDFLVGWASPLVDKYIQHRRCVLLNQARDILLHHDYHNTIPVGAFNDKDQMVDESLEIFRLPSCSISTICHDVLQLVRQTMEESIQKVHHHDDRLSLLQPTLYRTAREMLSLFRAIIPASHGTEIRQVPRMAAVFHNDCVYLAHHCLTLGLEYKEHYHSNNDGEDNESLQQKEQQRRGKLLQQYCIFVDMVPLFRELAETSLQDMLALQRMQILEICGPPRLQHLPAALASHESVQEWSDAETSLAAGTYHLRHLAQGACWKTILAKPVFVTCMSYLIDVWIQLFLETILPSTSSSTTSMTVITPPGKQFLLTLLNKAHDDWNSILSDSSPDDDNKKIRGYSDDSLAVGHSNNASQDWKRFQSVKDFLGMTTLEEVQAALTNGTFSSLASSELQWLLQATFSDSSQRRALLQTLRTAASGGGS